MMTKTATKLGVGIAGCAVAAAASLISGAPAQAAPVTVPAAPVNVSQSWFGGDFFQDIDQFFDRFFVPEYPDGRI
jgi:ABC-type glycerol-3-phosphate transport system substrate-binding protein